MNGVVRLAMFGVAAVLLLPLGMVVLFSAVLGDPAAAAWSCGTSVARALPSAGASTAPTQWEPQGDWDAEQVGHAGVIVQVGTEMNVPPYGWTIAVATAMQESWLRNLGDLGQRNDHDSLGLFQQRPSQGWGTPQQILDPRYASRKFYEKLLQVDGWQNMPLTKAAQAVQKSAYPNAYAKHQSQAQQLVDYVRTRLGITCDAGGTGTWQLPLPKGSYDFGSPFGPRGKSMHRGVDLIAPEGTPILAAAAGKVTSAGCTSAYCDRPGNPDLPGCGLAIEIQHAGGIGTTYCHAIRLHVVVGQQVNAGDRIADVGTTGHSSGNHLHFQVHRPAPPISNDTAIDPVPFMNTVGVQL